MLPYGGQVQLASERRTSNMLGCCARPSTRTCCNCSKSAGRRRMGSRRRSNESEPSSRASLQASRISHQRQYQAVAFSIQCARCIVVPVTCFPGRSRTDGEEEVQAALQDGHRPFRYPHTAKGPTPAACCHCEALQGPGDARSGGHSG